MKLGFIGCGNMAKAMLGGILKNEICAKEDVIATAKSEGSSEKCGCAGARSKTDFL